MDAIPQVGRGAGKGYAVGAVLKGGLLSAFAMLARVRARSSWWNFKFVFLVEFLVYFFFKKITSFVVD